MLASLVNNYVNAIRNGQLPHVQQALTYMAKHENETIMKECEDLYLSKMKEIKLPTESAKVTMSIIC